MAYIHLYRGGSPVFKPMFCEGSGAEFLPPFDAHHLPHTPPYDSHADAAHGQGYLNLDFPLVPHVGETEAHRWMQNLLKQVKNANDVILTNWVPLRSYLDSYYIELVTPDEDLTGVYVTPTAYRIKPDPADYDNAEAITITEITDLSDALNTMSGARQVPLGTPGADDKRYLMARFLNNEVLSWSFGHNMVTGESGAMEAYDDKYGAVVLGLKVTGTAAKIPLVATGHYELYISAKCLTFEGSSQIG